MERTTARTLGRLLTLAGLATFAALPTSAGADILGEHWVIVGGDGKKVVRDHRQGRPATAGQPVVAGTAYGLRNMVTDKMLVYGHQDWGINLKWSDKGHNITFHRASGSTGPLKYGERVAIKIKRGNDDGEYLYYKHRDTGPNLGWSNQPKYEWELRNGGETGEVKTDVEVGLFSRVEKDYLVYCKRPLSVNLRWFKDQESKGCHGLWGEVKARAKKELIPAAGAAVGGAVGGPVGAAVGKKVGDKID